MLSPEENELVTRTGAGTAMGEVMRRYWMPAALAWELPGRTARPFASSCSGRTGGLSRHRGASRADR